MALFASAKEAIVTLLDVLVRVDGEEDEPAAIVDVVKVLRSMRPALGSLTKVRKLLEKAADGLYADSWEDFLATKDRMEAAGLGEDWVAIIDRAVVKFALESEPPPPPPPPEQKSEGVERARNHFVTPKVSVELPTWNSTPGDCGEFFVKITTLLQQMLVPEAHWYHMIVQQITGAGKRDWENSLTGGGAGDALCNWIKKLVDMYDVDAQFLLLKAFKELGPQENFAMLRTEIMRIAQRLKKYGWTITDDNQVLWAGVCMRAEHWRKLKEYNPKSLQEIQVKIFELGLETPVTATGKALIVDQRRSHTNVVPPPRPPIFTGGGRELCKKFLKGHCGLGRKCKFMHPTKKCWDYAKGVCRRANCRFLHTEVTNPLDSLSEHVERPCSHCQGPPM
jgi:hypothetical protein